MTWRRESKAELLSRVEPAEGSIELLGFVRFPVWQCQKCSYRWVGIQLKRPARACPECKDLNWWLPRVKPPRKSHKSPHDKRTLV